MRLAAHCPCRTTSPLFNHRRNCRCAELQARKGSISIQQRIHIYGASGAGTTALGRALSEELAIAHLDTDNFYWKETQIPYTEKYTPAERIHNINKAISNSEAWILSGSLCSWGGPLTDLFTLTLFVYLTPQVRLYRLREREKQRYGSRIEKSGDMYENHIKFMEWAAEYDTASPPTRSLAMHRKWASELQCPTMELNSNQSVENLVQQVVSNQDHFSTHN